VDDLSDDRLRTTSLSLKKRSGSVHRLQDRGHVDEPESWRRGRSIWVMSPVMTACVAMPMRVRNISSAPGSCSAPRRGSRCTPPASAAHVGQRRHLEDAVVFERADHFRSDQVLHRVVERPQYGLIFCRVAGQIAEALPASTTGLVRTSLRFCRDRTTARAWPPPGRSCPCRRGRSRTPSRKT